MNKLNWQRITKSIDARHPNERVILLVGFLGVLIMAWLTLIYDAMVVAQETEARNITITDSLLDAEQTRQNDISSTYTSDPNTFAISRQRELRDAANDANSRLNGLYGELITPQQMSQVLTTILQRDTRLRLISLENQPSEALLSGPDPTEGEVIVDATTTPGVQVFRHGLKMVFEGNYLETIRYLRSLEQLNGNFFWDKLDFNLTSYPDGEISLEIYTLSTEQGWIGV